MKLPPNPIILIDMDGTLVSSNLANNLAYQTAISLYCPHIHSIPAIERITADTIQFYFPQHAKQIISYKKKIFPNFLSEIELHTELIEFIRTLPHNISVYLISHSLEQRAWQILTYFQLYGLFQKAYFLKKNQEKYPYIAKKLNLNPNNIVIFDDNLNELQYAAQYGIPCSQLFHVTLKKE